MVCGGGRRGLGRIHQILIFLFDLSCCLFFVSVSTPHCAERRGAQAGTIEGVRSTSHFPAPAECSWDERMVITYPNVRCLKSGFLQQGTRDGALCEVLMMWMNESGQRKTCWWQPRCALKVEADIRFNCWANWTCFLAVAPIYVHSVAVSPSSLLKWPLVRSSHSIAVRNGGRGGAQRIILYK